MRPSPQAFVDIKPKPTPARVTVIGRSLSIAPYTCIKCGGTTDMPAEVVETTGGPLCPGCYVTIKGERPCAV